MRVRLGAELLSEYRAFDFGIFSHPGLAEHCQQDYPPSGCEPVGDADGGTIHRGVEFADAVAEMPSVRLAEGLCVFGEYAHVFIDLEEVSGCQCFQPVPDFRLSRSGS
nr:hypothetical protein [Nocardia exalbida]